MKSNLYYGIGKTAVTLIALFTFNFAGAQPLDEVQKLTASDRYFDDFFGTTVSIDGDWILVGAKDQDRDVEGNNFLNQAGAAYFFKQNGNGAWVETQKVASSSRQTNAYFGNYIDLHGGRAILGAWNQDVNGVTGAGAAYIYELQPDDTWLEVAAIENPIPHNVDAFGSNVAIFGDYAMVEASREDFDTNEADSLNGAGAVYVYHRNGAGAWSLSQKLVNYDRAVSDRFGSSIALEDGFAVIGSSSQEGIDLPGGYLSQSGSAYAYEVDAQGQWQLVQKFANSNRAANDKFGYGSAISGNKLVVGALGRRYDGPGGAYVNSAGALYYFLRDPSTGIWTEQQELFAGVPTAHESFGWNIDMDADNLIATTFQDSYDENEQNVLALAGAAEVYQLDPATNLWSHRQKLVASDRTKRDYFGFSVAVSGNRILVGAYQEEHTDFGSANWKEDAGSVYFFTACSAISGQHTLSACDSYTVPSGDETYYASGTYSDTIPSAGGCDSILTLNVTMNATSSANTAVTACDAYVAPSGAVYVASGQYIDVIPNAAGCDSTITIDLTINNSVATDETVAVCDSYTSNSGVVYTASGSYPEAFTNQIGCDSVHTINVTVTHSTSLATSAIVCDVYIAPSGATFTASGVYQDTIPNAAGCDSVITIDLTVLQSSATSIVEQVCEQYVSGAGTVYEVSGTYTEHHTNQTGCDSTVILELDINYAIGETPLFGFVSKYSSEFRKVGAHFGSIVEVDGDWMFVGEHHNETDANEQNHLGNAGAVFVYHRNQNDGWDYHQKLVIQNRRFEDHIGGQISLDAASGRAAINGYLRDVIIGQDTLENAGAAFVFELQGTQWVQTTEIHTNDQHEWQFFGAEVSIKGDVLIATATQQHYDENGANYVEENGAAYEFVRDASGNWNQTQKIVNQDRNVKNWFGTALAHTDDYLLIDSRLDDGAELAGGYLRNSGAVYAFERDASGQWVEIQKIVASNRYAEQGFGIQLHADGNYAAISDWKASTISLTGENIIRAGSVFMFERDPATGLWSETQEVYDNYPSRHDLFGFRPQIQGDRMVVTSAYDSENEHQVDTVFQAGSVFIYDRDPSTGTWSATQKVVAPDRAYNALFGYATNLYNDELYITAFKESFSDINGSDSVKWAGALYQFDIEYTPLSMDTVVSCGWYLLASGDTVNSTGIYADTLVSVTGCDSILHYDVTILSPSEHAITAVSCGSYTSGSGVEYSATGVYSESLLNAAGCDSIVTLDLTINQATSSDMNVEVCGTYTAPSGQVLTTSGTYQDVIPNAAGCDSVITIVLSTDQSSASSLSAVACDVYVSPSGQQWTSTGVYTDTIANTAGCDSIITIDLTVTDPYGFISATTCSDYTVPSGDETYSVSGTYFDTLQTTNGCDSILEIDLVVTGQIQGPIAVCASSTHDYSIGCAIPNATYYKWWVKGRGHIVGSRKGSNVTTVTAAFLGKKSGPKSSTLICGVDLSVPPFYVEYEVDVDVLECESGNNVAYESLEIQAPSTSLCDGEGMLFSLNQPISETANYSWSVAGAAAILASPNTNQTEITFYSLTGSAVTATVYLVIELIDSDHYIQREFEVSIDECASKMSSDVIGQVTEVSSEWGSVLVQNPIAGNFVKAFTTAEVSLVHVYGYDGKLIAENRLDNQAGEGQITIPVHGLSSGIYVFQFFNHDGLVGRQKVVLSK